MRSSNKATEDCYQQTQLQIIEFRKFLRAYKLSTGKDRSAMVKAVKDFLAFKHKYSKYNDSQVLEIYLTHLKSNDSVKEKQIRQVKAAVKIYRSQFMEFSSQNNGESTTLVVKARPVKSKVEAMPPTETKSAITHQ